MRDKVFEKLKENIPGVQKDVPLAKYTTFKIGGRAKYFFVAKNKDDLIRALEWARDKKIPILILGGGSNILVSDKGFKGLAIQIRNSKFEIQNSNEVIADAGVNITKLAYFTAKHGLSGLEWSAGIPGTLGGSIYGSAQAFEDKISDIVETVEVFDRKSFTIKKYTQKKCRFSLKDSIFKKNKDLIIISAELKLKKEDKEEIKNKIKNFLHYRKTKHPLNFPSAGSVFVNTEITPAWQLIKECGLAGKKIGQAQISEKHANFIVNLGNAKSKDVLKLIKLAKKEVKKKFNINLELEIQLVGF